VASFGLHPNMILYLTTRYQMTAVDGAMVIYLWNAMTNFLPIFGAVLMGLAVAGLVTLAGLALSRYRRLEAA
jgi:peptide/histidine transporter 3/4